MSRLFQARHLSEGLVHVLNEFRFPCKDEAFLGKVRHQNAVFHPKNTLHIKQMFLTAEVLVLLPVVHFFQRRSFGFLLPSSAIHKPQTFSTVMT